MACTERYKCSHYWVTDEGDKEKKHSKEIVADDAHNDIDIEAIVAACDKIIEKAQELTAVDGMVKLYTSNITKEALCVNDTTVEGMSNECHEHVKTQIENIVSGVEKLKQDAITAFNTLQDTYNDIAIGIHRRMPYGSCQGKK